MNIALIGADGQLGSDLRTILPADSVQPLFFPDFDVTDAAGSAARLQALRPDVVINTSAFHRVDECEVRSEDAFRVNAFAVRDLARACRAMGSVLVHFSTDYVFDGRSGIPYTEEDRPGPLSVYAASKLTGEHLLAAEWDRHFIIRTCGLFGRAGCLEKGRNFVETMLWLASSGKPIRVVSDQIVAPTSTLELAANVQALLRTEAFGLYHLTSRGCCSWLEFAQAIFDLAKVKGDLRPVGSAEFGARARRPAYSVLADAKARALGLPGCSDWKAALAVYLEARARETAV
ncbi:MAG: dTDP-4-dehydrorhamnose reductase [Candidatus Aminicenantes bacterium]|nr:dTDP-4-dehydrorhamnose reductase [Candidatus Aminicenantes bacterium]